MKGKRQRELNEQKLTICIVCDLSDKKYLRRILSAIQELC